VSVLIFDAGPIISLATSGLLWTLDELKKRFDGQFIIPTGVKRELVDRPLGTVRFKFEALQVQRLIERGVLNVVDDPQVIRLADKLLGDANRIFSAHAHHIQIVQRGEMETLAAASIYKADGIVVDERITRTLLENPNSIKELMEHRLHMQLSQDEHALRAFSEQAGKVAVFRSIELLTMAFEKGILDKYVAQVPHARRELLESVLWAVKLNGCSISDDEINEIVRLEKV